MSGKPAPPAHLPHARGESARSETPHHLRSSLIRQHRSTFPPEISGKRHKDVLSSWPLEPFLSLPPGTALAVPSMRSGKDPRDQDLACCGPWCERRSIGPRHQLFLRRCHRQTDSISFLLRPAASTSSKTSRHDPNASNARPNLHPDVRVRRRKLERRQAST